jgi:hypothetical protein
MLSFPRNPTTTDYQDYFTGDLWLNNNRNDLANFQSLWYYASQLGNVATWIRLSGGAGNLQTLTGDVGGPVFPLANNININGLNGIVITGNIAPASPHQLTIGSSSGFNFLESISGNDMIKVYPDGTGNIQTLGAGNVGNPFEPVNNLFNNIWTYTISANTELFALANSIIQPPTQTTGGRVSGMYALGTTGLTTDRFMHNYGTQNTWLGYQAGNLTLTVADATNNVGVGYQSLTGLTTGDGNSSVGFFGLLSCTTGSTNSNIGGGGINLLTSGSGNSNCGYSGLNNLLTGNNNCSLGLLAGSNFTGAESNNINIGANNVGIVGQNNIINIGTTIITGDENVFIGQGTANINYTVGTAATNTGVGSSVFTAGLTTGVQNSAFGAGALKSMTSGSANTAIGQGALQNAQDALHNTAVGFGAMLGAVTNVNLANLSVGLQSMLNGTQLVQNTAIGVQALWDVGQGGSTATGNVAVGYTTGINYTTNESYNIILGYNNRGVIGESNTMRLGVQNGGPEDTTRAFVYGVTGVGVAGAAVLVTAGNQLGVAVSSIKYKTNIRQMEDESEDIYKLTPVIFNYKDDEDGPDCWGLIAEEVEQFMPRLVAYDQHELPMSVKYHELPILLLNEIKKLKKEIDDLKRRF